MATDPEARAAELERLAADLKADQETLQRLAVDCLTQRDRLRGDNMDRGAASIVALGMHAYYTAIESAIERIERRLATPPPPGPAWHQELLWGSTRPIGDSRPAVLTVATVRELDKLRGFRHFLRHAYAVELDASELIRTVGHLESAHVSLLRELDEMQSFLAQMAADLRR